MLFRASCRRDCKQKIGREDTAHHSTSILQSKSDTNTQNKHNITTIINLHNIINNTNQIDIPIKINNTNYNNITLMQEDEAQLSYAGGGFAQQQPRIEVDQNGNRCCQVIGPRTCQRVQQFPYMRCFHYR